MSSRKYTRKPNVSIFFADPDENFDLRVIQVAADDGTENWSFEFSFFQERPKNSRESDIVIVHSSILYDTYQEAAIAGYQMSELLGYATAPSEIDVIDWRGEVPVIVNKIPLEQLERWYKGEECPFCGNEDLEDEENEHVPEGVLVH